MDSTAPAFDLAGGGHVPRAKPPKLIPDRTHARKRKQSGEATETDPRKERSHEGVGRHRVRAYNPDVLLLHAIVVGALLQLTTASHQGAATVTTVTSLGAAERDKLVMALNDQRVEVRRSAASALALQNGIGPAIPALYAALLDSDRAVRRSACEAIRRFRGATPEDMLRDRC